MKLQYSMAHEPLLDTATRDALVANMKRAGIQKIWIAGFFSGKMVDIEELKEAKAFVEHNGLEVGAVTIPIGHPGNALNPDDPDLDLEIPKHWHYRVDNEGETVYFCGAIDTCLIEDNGKVAQILHNAGFKEVFLDDDLRVGNFNEFIEGCYCDACVTEFNGIYHHSETRETLMVQITRKLNLQLMKDWVSFQCDKITAVMKATDIEGVQPGIMVMHFGDERHGIDIPAIREQIPNALFRVGELQFKDASFTKPSAKAEEMLGITYHLNFMDKELAYSESTIFPPRSLKEHNLVYKAKMAITAGLENVLFMSGTWVLDDSYWQAIAAALPVLQELDKATANTERFYPVHLAYGTHGSHAEPIVPTSLPILAGLPVKPVRADQNSEGGDLLLFFGDYELGAEWQKKLPLYKQVIFDQKAIFKNKDILQQLEPSAINFINWDHQAASKPVAEDIALLQSLVEQGNWSFPRFVEGSNIGLVWLKESRKVILYNLLETVNQGIVKIADSLYPVRLKALSFAIMDSAGTFVEYDTEITL
ncbi:hypothetical protein EHS13_34905 [Paenibacillus psychroresistens]|uniref:Uncharacterized protein n=1 Tax=Paenibacillus psychroresistens TaxID=1778678 RepID=A0A6B8RV92_9BACL|nr:hypothetical protein [Paenibacillus psychroresistens]QGQ99684.1 hypothetical protein EHS13_34905 [Paenibacillus psychroresistens]